MTVQRMPTAFTVSQSGRGGLMQMHRIVVISILLLVLLGGPVAKAQAAPTILATTDFDCNWRLDGQSMGLLKADDSKAAQVSTGKHLVQAATADGLASFRAMVEVSQGQEVVEITLKAEHDQNAAIAGNEGHTWIDPSNSADVGALGQRRRCELAAGRELLSEFEVGRLFGLAPPND